MGTLAGFIWTLFTEKLKGWQIALLLILIAITVWWVFFREEDEAAKDSDEKLDCESTCEAKADEILTNGEVIIYLNEDYIISQELQAEIAYEKCMANCGNQIQL